MNDKEPPANKVGFRTRRDGGEATPTRMRKKSPATIELKPAHT